MVFITRELGEVVHTVIAEVLPAQIHTPLHLWWSALWRFLATLTFSTPPPTVAKL